MRQLVEKMKKIRDDIERKRGPLTLVALFQREESHVWDPVFCASWLDRNGMEDLRFLVGYFQKHLADREIVKIRGVFIVNYDDPPIRRHL
jgi:hypothetical protein